MGGAGGPRDGVNHPGEVAAVVTALDAVPRDATVVLAVSGGPDSVGMMRLVVAARPDLQCSVVHVRHGLRDDAYDAALAAQHAAAAGLGCRVIGVTVDRRGSGPEDAARRARWGVLVTSAREAGAGFILTGHTADDQAETVLLNIARGTGLPGAAGMPQLLPVAPGVTAVRPVLGLRRAAVRAVAAETGLPLADDPTNADPDQRRHRARHDVLPRLADLTGAATDPVESLTRLARHAQRDNEALDALARDVVRASTGRWGPVRVLAEAPLAGLHPAVATRVIRMVVARVGDGLLPSEATVAAVLALTDGQVAELPGGIVASRGGGLLAVADGYRRAAVRELVADEVVLPEIGMRLRRDGETTAGTLPPWAPPRAARVARVGSDPLVVRPRHPGDRIETAGGSRSVGRAMAAAGVPRIARDLIPVVEDAAGVVWVPGVAIRPAAAGSRPLRLEPLAVK